MIDKTFVKKSFNASAATYDIYAGLQKRLVEDLMVFAALEACCIQRVLDVGMGTGNLFAVLQKKFSSAKVYGCDLALRMIRQACNKITGASERSFFTAADAEFLPFTGNLFDLVVSSFTYQWLDTCDRAFQEANRILKPGGDFVFSVFGKKTFYELRTSYREACAQTGYRQGEALELSLTEDNIKQGLQQGGFNDICIRAYRIVETYPSLYDLITSIKGMGARNASGRRNRTPGVRTTLRRMIEIYEQEFGHSGRIPATFEIIMAKGSKTG